MENRAGPPGKPAADRKIMTEPSDEEIQVLFEALDDEYKAFSTYDQVIKDFGPIRPFINIREAEGRHIAALLGLFERYHIPVPDNPWPGNVPRYASMKEACQAGIEAEIANGEMYDRLIHITRREDILTVLENLQTASQQRHLPAFRRCAERGSDGGGRRRHAGHCGGREHRVDR
jgi:hypothetical protein